MRAKKSEEKKPQENGTGSFTSPRVRGDGTAMVKMGLSVPVTFAQRFKAFTGQLPLGVNSSDWVVKTLTEAMDKQRL
jgi:hypothetical protein